MKLLRTAVAAAMVVLLSDVRASLTWGADVGNGASATLGRGKAGAVCMAAGCGVLPHGQGLHRAGTVYAHAGTNRRIHTGSAQGRDSLCTHRN